MDKSAKIISGVFLAAAVVFMGLWFMGAVSFPNAKREVKERKAEEEISEPDMWEIVYEGRMFSVDSCATAYIHESGCLNIRFSDDYLIQVAAEEESIDDFWNDREEKLQSIEDSGYRIETEPKRVTAGGREYVRYVISMEDEEPESGRIYMQVLFTPTDDDRRFLVCIKYDGTDMEALDQGGRDDRYEQAFKEVQQIFDTSVLTGQEEDAVGSIWLPNLYTEEEKEYLSGDTLEYADGRLAVSYRLPAGCYLLPDALMGRNYRTEDDNIYINVKVWENISATAEEKAAMHSGAGISKIHTQGETVVQGKTFYYYTYSILRSSRTEKSYTYYFTAYHDLENGGVLEISGWSYENAEAMDSAFYAEVMDITESPVK